MDRCSRCSSVHLVKRLGEVECRDCGAIVSPEGPGETGLAEAGFTEAGLAEAPGEEPGATPGGPVRRLPAVALTCPRKWPGLWTGC